LKTAIIIPAYNESATIARVVEDVRPYGTPVVVDDASSDGTAELAAASGAKVVRHARNRGYDGALQSGFERAAALGVDAAISFDADGQHDAAGLGKMIKLLESGEVDLVIGVRPRSARFSEALFNLYTRLRFGVPDILCGFKGYRMSLYHARGRFDGTRSIGTELALAALRGGVHSTTIAVAIHPRQGQPRIGASLRANLHILRALLLALRTDLSASDIDLDAGRCGELDTRR
jgi:glycosyltransferase involved in cell wall biosynthesis